MNHEKKKSGIYVQVALKSGRSIRLPLEYLKKYASELDLEAVSEEEKKEFNDFREKIKKERREWWKTEAKKWMDPDDPNLLKGVRRKIKGVNIQMKADNKAGPMKVYDTFKNFTYDQTEWSAQYLHTVSDVEECAKSLTLVGRKIKHMKTIGLCYNLDREDLEEYAYSRLNCSEEEKQKKSNYKNIDNDLEYPRFAEIDEPFMIEFEDGDVFEIDALMDYRFRMGMNRIPWNIRAGTNLPNADADVLFGPCVGKILHSVEVVPGKEDSSSPYSVILWMADEFCEKLCGLEFCAFFDFCHVNIVSSNDKKYDMIKMGELKTALYNYEDLHFDDNIEFKSLSGALFFGDKGKEFAEPVYITLSPSSNKSSVNISYANDSMDFLPIAWSIMLYTKDWFDEYGEYEFTSSQWSEILSITKKLLSFNCFDGFFDFMVDKKICDKRNGKTNISLYCLNNNGTLFWKNKDRYIRMLNDIESWTEIVLGKDDMMNVYGF